MYFDQKSLSEFKHRGRGDSETASGGTDTVGNLLFSKRVGRSNVSGVAECRIDNSSVEREFVVNS
jgi:hypothetical protein